MFNFEMASSFFNAYTQFSGSSDNSSIVSFRSALDNPPAWSTYFGSLSPIADDVARGAATYKNRKLYIVGATQSPTIPLYVQQPGGAWVQGSLAQNGTPDGFITRFNISSVSTSSVGELSNPPFGDLLIYPNPTVGAFTLSFSLLEKGNVNILVYNSIGELVYSEKMQNQKGMISKTVDLSALSNGMYFVQITNNQMLLSGKIILEK